MATFQTLTRKTLHFAQTLCTISIITFLTTCFIAGFILFMPLFMAVGLSLIVAGRVYGIVTTCKQQWVQQLAAERSAMRRLAGIHRRAWQRYGRLSFGRTQLS